MTLPADLSNWPTSKILNTWFAIMNGRAVITEYENATSQERADFFIRLSGQIDGRIPPVSFKAALEVPFHKAVRQNEANMYSNQSVDEFARQLRNAVDAARAAGRPPVMFTVEDRAALRFLAETVGDWLDQYLDPNRVGVVEASLAVLEWETISNALVVIDRIAPPASPTKDTLK